MANTSSTYTGAPTSARDFTRLCLGDTDRSAPIFTDGEVDAAVTELTFPTLAAAALADARSAMLANKADSKKIGKTAFTFREQSARWQTVADRLRMGSPGNLPSGHQQWTGGIDVGGITRAEVDELRTDTKHEPFAFELGMDDINQNNNRDDDDRC